MHTTLIGGRLSLFDSSLFLSEENVKGLLIRAGKLQIDDFVLQK